MSKETLLKHIGIIKKLCIKEIKNIEAIILYGSYGRNEGAWIKETNEYRAYNDYDILIITKISNIPKKTTKLVETSIKKKINIQFIDISYLKYEQLSKLKPTQSNYDLKYGSKIIYGNKEVLKIIPQFKKEEIKLEEGEKQFLTRLWTFCGVINKIKDLDEEESLFFRYQMSKALHTCIDCKLFLNGLYHASYKERLKLFKSIENKPDNIFDWALKQKLKPSNKAMSKKEVNTIFSKVISLYKKYTLELLSQQYSKNFTDFDNYYHCYKKNVFTIIKIILYPILKRSFKFYTLHKIYLAQILCLSILLNEKNKTLKIKEVNKLLKTNNLNVKELMYITSKKRICL